MKRVLFLTLCLAVVGVMFFALSGSNVDAAGSNLSGVAYIAGHGGHLSVIDLATMAAPDDIEKGRIVINEAGSEMEGTIAGMQFEEIKKGGGTHGSAFSKDKSKIVVGLLNGDVVTYDLKTNTRSKPVKLGKKFCDAVAGPDGNIYFEDMADGNVYVWDPSGMKAVDKFPVGASVCGIAWTHDTKKAYVSDMPQGKIFVLDWKTKKTIKEISDPEMTFIHQIVMTNDGKQLWVAAPNEFDPGLAAGTHKSQIVIIDTKKDVVVDHIELPNDIRPHDFEFTPDGKKVLLAARTYGNDSVLVVMDAKSKKIEQKVSACYACHSKYGIEVSIDAGSPLLCGILVDWK